MPKCSFVKPDGSGCGAWATSSGFCFMHDPAAERAAKLARSKGGSKYSAPSIGAEISPPKTEAEVLELISNTIKALWEGKVDHRRAKAVRDLCMLQLRVIRDARAADLGDSTDRFATMSTDDLKKLAKEMLGDD